MVLYLILRFQDRLPLNPQGFTGVSPDLAFKTAVSFVSNANWQSYVPETTLSTFSQMAGLTSHNFLSAAAGIAVAAAVARAFAANRGEGIGNFWADLTRVSLYVLLPISLVLAIADVALGEPQTLVAHVTAWTPDDRPLSDRKPGGDQAARRQRRRLQRQLGAPLREPERLDPSPPALILTEPGVGYRWMG